MRGGQKKSRGSYMSLRKALRKEACAKYPGKAIGWVGGILYFLELKAEVPGVKKVPRPNKEAVGWSANEQAKPKEYKPVSKAPETIYLNHKAWWCNNCDFRHTDAKPGAAECNRCRTKFILKEWS